jgi:hypothetical protein
VRYLDDLPGRAPTRWLASLAGFPAGAHASPASRCPLLHCRDEFGFYFLGEAFEGFLGLSTRA